jgi:hypothetical protein
MLRALFSHDEILRRIVFKGGRSFRRTLDADAKTAPVRRALFGETFFFEI